MKISFYLFFLVYMQTFGQFLDENDLKETALIIIDMQSGFRERNRAYLEHENKVKYYDLLDHQIEIINFAKYYKMKIVLVEYKNCEDYPCNFGETDLDLLNSIKGYEHVFKAIKNYDSIFDRNDPRHSEVILNYLKSNKIKNLIVIGANGGACVYSSIIDSLLKKFKVYAYNQGIADFNTKDFTYPYYYTDLKLEELKCFKNVSNLNELTNSYRPNFEKIYDSKLDAYMYFNSLQLTPKIDNTHVEKIYPKVNSN